MLLPSYPRDVPLRARDAQLLAFLSRGPVRSTIYIYPAVSEEAVDRRAGVYVAATGAHADGSASRCSILLGGAGCGNPEGGCIWVGGMGDVDTGCGVVCVVAGVGYCGGVGKCELEPGGGVGGGVKGVEYTYIPIDSRFGEIE